MNDGKNWLHNENAPAFKPARPSRESYFGRPAGYFFRSFDSMNLDLRATLAAMLLALPTGLAAQQAVNWVDLVDAEAQVFDDPYRTLTAEQIDQLRTVAQAKALYADKSRLQSDREDAEARMRDAKAALAEAGLDADWLISQRWVVAERREAAANKGNTDIDGLNVSLSGFVIPAMPDPDGTPAVYLVETRGIYSHMPPPMPNQLIRVRLETDWSPKGLYQPVRLSGRLQIDPSEQVIRVVDGPVPMKATWRLDASSAETLTPAAMPASESNDWIEQLRDKVQGPTRTEAQ
ncbi:DUF3299 domain-containing protein [Fluviibacterium sp. DFM31]|uniref:DUF3299 domain-containing protein n=1 Tax=Meridianimarinicoccus marinus TaxID=3231483 RepID=A0ABV3LBQ8_9RHOB